MHDTTVMAGDRERLEAVLGLLREDAISIVFQPIIQLAGGGVLGYEALARFDAALPLRTDEWFDLAWRLNLGPDLELACWQATAAAGPPPDGRSLFVNCRPETLNDPRARPVRASLGPDLVLELSERDEVRDYTGLRQTLDQWTADGDRIAIDDTGAGYASLRHVVQLAPDFLKLDRSLIHGVHHDRNKRAMVCALVAYAEEAGTTVIAEGIERAEELSVLRDLGVHLAQGFLLAKPDAPWPSTVWAPNLAVASGADGGMGMLTEVLADAGDARTACDRTAEFLARGGDLIPSVYLERDGVLRCQAQRGLWQVLDGMPPTAGITGRAFRTGRTVIVPDIAADDEYLEAVPGIRAEACVPISVDGRVVGALNVESYGALPERALAELTQAAAMLGERLQVVGLGPARTASSRLPRLATLLAGVADEAELRLTIGRVACDLAGMNSALLCLPGTESPPVVAYGPLAGTFRQLDQHQLASLGQLVSVVTSCYTAGDTTGACFRIAESLRTAGARSVVVLPLDAQGRRLGFLLVAHTTPLRITTDEVEALELLAAHAALCLETHRLLDDWRRKAVTDPLTGLGNHAAFRAALDAWAVDAPPTALLMADVDGFKTVNDRFGHLVGDQVLRGVADAMQAAVRPGDQLFRIGGDEFALLVEGAGEEEVADIARRVQRAVERHLRPRGAALSLGATHLDADATIESLIERADRNLYEAKRRGGGQLRLAG